MARKCKILNVLGHRHVLIDNGRKEKIIHLSADKTGHRPINYILKSPNYLNSGMALCGIMKDCEDLDEFFDRKKDLLKNIIENN